MLPNQLNKTSNTEHEQETLRPDLRLQEARHADNQKNELSSDKNQATLYKPMIRYQHTPAAAAPALLFATHHPGRTVRRSETTR